MRRYLSLSLATSLISLVAALPSAQANAGIMNKTPTVGISGEGNVAFYGVNSSQQNANNGQPAGGWR